MKQLTKNGTAFLNDSKNHEAFCEIEMTQYGVTDKDIAALLYHDLIIYDEKLDIYYFTV